jgi:serine/threonine protein kinase/formylglycine-generating enzyme required for sulfatase activity
LRELSVTSVLEQLQQLADLLEKELITREQFEEQRDRILAESRIRTSAGTSDPTMLTEVGAYRLLGLIGEGGMGAVYRGRHRSEAIAERQGVDVAVKVIHPQFARNPDYRNRFEREAALGLMLDHPGIVKVHDLVVDAGNLALVMDFVDGRPLSESIGDASSPVPWDEAWPLVKKLLDAVGYAHDQGVVHRDLKPENILVTSDGEPRVIDFGIAKDLDQSGTRTGTGMGTVEYMAPEQYIDAKSVDRRADIYSFGMMLYEMLAGRLPWESGAPQFEILEQKARKELLSPSAFCPDIPREIVAALSPALAVDAGSRPTSCAAFARALADASRKAAERSRMEAELRQAEEEALREAEEAAQRKAGEEARQAQEVAERRLREVAERQGQHSTPREPRTSTRSGKESDQKRQKGARRLLPAWGALAVLLLVAGPLLVVGVKNGKVLSVSSHAPEFEMVPIEPGEFWMGRKLNVEGVGDGETRHKVRLTRAYEIGATEVTQALYDAVMGENPAFSADPERPVEQVNWLDAIAFCNELSKQEDRRPAYLVQGANVSWDKDADGYRLPTEAEWEYAAQGGEKNEYSGTDGLSIVRWSSSAVGYKTQKVGGKQANGYGLYDTKENVWEWVWDWYGGDTSDAVQDPEGPSTGSGRVIRNGSWSHLGSFSANRFRDRSVPGDRRVYLGFRLARSLP